MRAPRSLGIVLPILAACSGSGKVDSDAADQALTAGGTRASHVAKAADLSSDPPRAGRFRVHMIDVGTGLSMLVQGHDFNMLYDGGSTDDSRGITANVSSGGNESRLLAYLFATVGPSGGPECTPQGDRWPAGESYPQKTIDHLVLSHAHRDHLSMLPEVFHCYSVKHVWEPGAVFHQDGYADFVANVFAEPGVTYHTAKEPPRSLPHTFLGATIPEGFKWRQYGENDRAHLGANAEFKVLHVDPEASESRVNDSSVVLRVQLGSHVLLLMGDAEAGLPDGPNGTVNLAEKDLLDRHADELEADILQVGHHGSATSSRRPFLDKVFPTDGRGQRYALLSVGPTPYSNVSLPDRSVVREIEGMARVKLLATNEHDRGHCPAPDRVGVDDDAPGGCDNYVLDLDP